MDFTQPARPRRKPSLTPMIDVVFLLLVFFMLASRFGVATVLPLPLASQGGEYSGPPRLITVTPTTLHLNGQPVTELAAALAPLMSSPTDTLILRGRDGATLQRIVDVTEILNSAGFTSLVLVE
ncbi:MAG: indolepyruvate ferredoxin oxidoreductase [Rhodobacteraceae bacterium]|nr:MAG: indolepyruvate ferredoxin oxidoreductase [Paracoccaceae bacterium]